MNVLVNDGQQVRVQEEGEREASNREEKKFTKKTKKRLTLGHTCHIKQFSKVSIELPPFAVLSALFLMDQNC